MAIEEKPKPQIIEVVIKKVDISFGDLVGLMIKIGIASVPAAVILAIVYVFAIAMIGGILGS